MVICSAASAAAGARVHNSMMDASWSHIASFRCAAGFGCYRGLADIDQASPIKLGLRVAPWSDHRERCGTITKPIFNGAIRSRGLAHARNSRHAYPPRRYHAAVRRTARATPYVPPPARGGARVVRFFLGTAACSRDRSPRELMCKSADGVLARHAVNVFCPRVV